MKKMTLLILALAVLLCPPSWSSEDAVHKMVMSLFDYDRSVPVKVIKGKVEKKDGLEFTWMMVVSTKDIQVPVLMVRNLAKAPDRILMVQHGNSSHKENERLLFIAKGLIKQKNYVALLTDALYHGERTSPQVGKWGGGNLVNQPNNVRDIFLQTVKDHRRVLDAAKSDLDLNLPVDYLGESLGSLMGTLTVLLDNRIERGIFMVGGADFLKINPMARTIKGVNEFRQVVDPYYHAPYLKKPILLLNGKIDMIIPPAAGKTLYDRLGSTNKKQIWYDIGHGLDPETVLKDTVTWLNSLKP